MKKIIIGMMILSSINSFAQVLSRADGNLVMEAVKMSLNTNVLNCHDWSHGFPSSDLEYPFTFTEIKINEGSQPVISAKYEDSNGIWKSDIFTDQTLQKVTAIKIKIDTKKTRKVNIGTITRPVIVDEAYLEFENAISCKPKKDV